VYTYAQANWRDLSRWQLADTFIQTVLQFGEGILGLCFQTQPLFVLGQQLFMYRPDEIEQRLLPIS
jgi:hypothetical protein